MFFLQEIPQSDNLLISFIVILNQNVKDIPLVVDFQSVFDLVQPLLMRLLENGSLDLV
jgi:hypothetical protein